MISHKLARESIRLAKARSVSASVKKYDLTTRQTYTTDMFLVRAYLMTRGRMMEKLISAAVN